MGTSPIFPWWKNDILLPQHCWPYDWTRGNVDYPTVMSSFQCPCGRCLTCQRLLMLQTSVLHRNPHFRNPCWYPPNKTPAYGWASHYLVKITHFTPGRFCSCEAVPGILRLYVEVVCSSPAVINLSKWCVFQVKGKLFSGSMRPNSHEGRTSHQTIKAGRSTSLISSSFWLPSLCSEKHGWWKSFDEPSVRGPKAIAWFQLSVEEGSVYGRYRLEKALANPEVRRILLLRGDVFHSKKITNPVTINVCTHHGSSYTVSLYLKGKDDADYHWIRREVIQRECEEEVQLFTAEWSVMTRRRGRNLTETGGHPGGSIIVGKRKPYRVF